MRKQLISVFAIIAAMAVVGGCGQQEFAAIEEDNELYEGNELYVEAGDFDVYFELVEPFSETYMVFGGDPVTHAGAFNNFWLAGISMADARPIYEEHSDFYMCASPGAARAKKAVKTMNIVTANSYVLKALNEVISEFKNRIGRGGDRVAVRLEGVKLEMTAAVVRQAGKDMMDRLPKQTRSNYFLVRSVKMVDAKAELEGS
jgi:alkanesulfonate monooxygenase SsuD/methylene tetrahydromethanopterin reductase-like flavin-dependent oxidoreductase (luciferase family)